MRGNRGRQRGRGETCALRSTAPQRVCLCHTCNLRWCKSLETCLLVIPAMCVRDICRIVWTARRIPYYLVVSWFIWKPGSECDIGSLYVYIRLGMWYAYELYVGSYETATYTISPSWIMIHMSNRFTIYREKERERNEGDDETRRQRAEGGRGRG